MWEYFESGRWITPAIHVWAGLTLLLAIIVYLTHRSALLELAQRIGRIQGLIERKPPAPVSPEKMGGLLLFLGDQIQKLDVDLIAPIIQYVRQEEKAKTLQVHLTLVHITETMIELFPMLGIFGTVWGFSGIKDFSSRELLGQFTVAVDTTLFGLIYFIAFRLIYAAMVQAKIAALDQHSLQFQEFLSALERRSGESAGLADDGDAGYWGGRTRT